MSDSNFEHSRVLVVGLGVSGRAAATALSKRGIDVVAIDASCSEDLEAAAIDLALNGVEVHLGTQDEAHLQGRDLVVVSPGVRGDAALLAAAGRRRIPVWSEIELAWRLVGGLTVVGVTGTNGKTTTTTLIGNMLETAGVGSKVAGNIGHPLVGAVLEEPPDAVLVTELSSFQLAHVDKFRPHVAVILNITEDHLDWHSDFSEYAAAKERIFENQTPDDFAVINVDDAAAVDSAAKARSRRMPVSLRPQSEGVWVEGARIVARLPGGEPVSVMARDELRIRGEHNLTNAMCATAAALCLGVDVGAISRALREFRGLRHRVQFIGRVGEVGFYDDSKATNPDATVRALGAFDKPVVLMLGGRNKGNSFEPVVQAARGRVAAVVLFGEAAGEIEKAFRLAGSGLPVETVPELAAATARALELAGSGRPVLLSPACASFDVFSGYEERGQAFVAAVAALGGEMADV